MEPRGCNRWQSPAIRPAAETAETSEIRCRALRPVASPARSPCREFSHGRRAFERSGALQSYSKRRILPLKHRLLGNAAEGRPYEEETIGGVPRIRVGAVGAGARLGARTAPNNESATYEWHLEVPNVAMAPNGDTVAVTGTGDVRRTSEVRLGRRQLHAHVRGRRQPNRHVYGGWAGRPPAVRPRRRGRQPAPVRSLRRPVGAAGQPGAGREPVVVVGRSTA